MSFDADEISKMTGLSSNAIKAVVDQSRPSVSEMHAAIDQFISDGSGLLKEARESSGFTEIGSRKAKKGEDDGAGAKQGEEGRPEPTRRNPNRGSGQPRGRGGEESRGHVGRGRGRGREPPHRGDGEVCGPIPPLAPPLAARSVHLWFRAPAITLAVQERSVRRASRRACACNACTISHPSLPPSSHSHPPPRLPSPSAYPRPARALRRRTAVVLTLGNALLRPPYPPPPTTLLSSPPLSFRSSPTHPRAPSRDRIRDGRLRVETCCERVGESEKIGRAPDACRAV